MLTATVPRHALPRRIRAYLAAKQQPVHYARLAKVLGADPVKVNRICIRLANAGTLRWCGEGLYTVREEKMRHG